jgi:hypothetical protein
MDATTLFSHAYGQSGRANRYNEDLEGLARLAFPGEPLSVAVYRVAEFVAARHGNMKSHLGNPSIPEDADGYLGLLKWFQKDWAAKVCGEEGYRGRPDFDVWLEMQRRLAGIMIKPFYDEKMKRDAEPAAAPPRPAPDAASHLDLAGEAEPLTSRPTQATPEIVQRESHAPVAKKPEEPRWWQFWRYL